MKRTLSLSERFPPSSPCGCDVCLAYCRRPGWWTVREAERAIEAGHARRMMLELSPDRTLGVLSPAFRGNEATFAYNEFSSHGCTFLNDGKCELHGTRFQPLECRFCHHDRRGEGPRCHRALEKDWNSPAGRALVARWASLVGLLRT